MTTPIREEINFGGNSNEEVEFLHEEIPNDGGVQEGR